MYVRVVNIFESSTFRVTTVKLGCDLPSREETYLDGSWVERFRKKYLTR